ncbi:GET complex subunit get1 [Pseudocyphellaria aurata]|nr:GET complex subunit get1 [Pseudocyphellaria aurata]
MASLLVIVFLLQLLIHLINTLGAPAINNLLWAIYRKISPAINASVTSLPKLRAEVFRLSQEMNSTSSQDEFAKWAKLRRQHDKAVAHYDEQASSLKEFKNTFDKGVSVIRWIGTNGMRTIVQFWYAKRPLFWIPRGWVPWYIEWLLAFPRAPRGSVSIQIWGTACATVIQFIGAAVVATWVLRQSRRQEGTKKEKVSVGSDGSAGSVGSGSREGKKEL